MPATAEDFCVLVVCSPAMPRIENGLGGPNVETVLECSKAARIFSSMDRNASVRW